MKKVLLLGDSIRQSYQPPVKEKLSGIAEVMGPEENCRFAKYTLWCVNSWIGEFSKPDIIHWNNGIWDIYHLNEDMGIFTPMDEYTAYLERILRELRKTGAVIIWATTTPVNDKNINCRNSEIDKYNAAALELMKKENIPINELNKTVKRDIASYICDDFLHLSEKGLIACAEAVVKTIMKYL